MKISPAYPIAGLCLFMAVCKPFDAAGQQSPPEITIPALTPLFAEPDSETGALLITSRPVRAELLKTELTLTRKHPLARYWHFSQVRLPDGVTGYIEPQISVEFNDAGKPVMKFHPATPWWRLLLIWGVGIGLIFTLLSLLRHYTGRRVLSGRSLHVRLILLIVLIRQALLLALVHGGGNIIANPSDDYGYFENLHNFLNMDFSKPWHFTVGQSIMYLPFVLLTGAESVNEIMIPFSYFSGFVMAPLCLAAGYLIAYRLTTSRAVALVSMLLWAILPFFYHHTTGFTPERIFSSYFNLFDTNFSFPHYINLISGGFNAMSDVPSTLAILTCIALILYLKPAPWNYALIAFIFAFGCMLRINNILFLPLLALLAWYNDKRQCLFRSRKHFLAVGALAAAAFAIGFLPQFLVNAYFYGNPLRFSYIRYAEGAHTYLSWIFFELNSGYYGSTNYLVWILGGMSMLFMRDARLRAILAWWALPVIFFFTFYSHGTDDPIRFIMTSYPAFFIAIAGCEIWRNLKGCRRLLPLVFAAAWVLLEPNMTVAKFDFYLDISNWFRRLIPHTALNWALYAAMGAALWGLRKHAGAVCFLVPGTFLFLYGNAYWAVLLLCGVMARALWDTFHTVFRPVTPAGTE